MTFLKNIAAYKTPLILKAPAKVLRNILFYVLTLIKKCNPLFCHIIHCFFQNVIHHYLVILKVSGIRYPP